jgi:hypothetical protein
MRAVQMVRARAAEFKLDPEKVGYIGFLGGFEYGALGSGHVGTPASPNAGGSGGAAEFAAGLPGAGCMVWTPIAG